MTEDGVQKQNAPMLPLLRWPKGIESIMMRKDSQGADKSTASSIKSCIAFTERLPMGEQASKLAELFFSSFPRNLGGKMNK